MKVLLSLALSAVFFIRSADAAESYLVQYEENAESYVEYPDDPFTQALLALEVADDHPKVFMGLWSTVIDFRHPLYYLVKGIFRRLHPHALTFQPQYFLEDGKDRGCRMTDPLSGKEVASYGQDFCLQQCSNHGRYCAPSLPEDPEMAAKINGVSILEETLRQICVW